MWFQLLPPDLFIVQIRSPFFNTNYEGSSINHFLIIYFVSITFMSEHIYYHSTKMNYE